MITRIIRQKVSPGTRVKFILKTGKEVYGILEEVAEDYVSINVQSNSVVIAAEFIGGWEVYTGDSEEHDPQQKNTEYLGLPEETVIERVEFDWQDMQPQEKTANLLRSPLNFSPSSNHKAQTRKMFFYAGWTLGIGMLIIFILIVVNSYF